VTKIIELNTHQARPVNLKITKHKLPQYKLVYSHITSVSSFESEARSHGRGSARTSAMLDVWRAFAVPDGRDWYCMIVLFDRFRPRSAHTVIDVYMYDRVV
jgi:hypothetical protein